MDIHPSMQNINRNTAVLMSLILESEGYPAFWIVEGDSASILTDAPEWTVADAYNLATVGE